MRRRRLPKEYTVVGRRVAIFYEYRGFGTITDFSPCPWTYNCAWVVDIEHDDGRLLRGTYPNDLDTWTFA